MNVVVVGSCNIDLVARMTRSPEAGETVLCDTYFTAHGGKGANQAVAAARLGAHVTFVASVGADAFGKDAVDEFQREGIDTGYIHFRPDSPTGTAFIWLDASGENRIVVASGANNLLTPADIDEAADAIGQAEVLLCQLETPIDTVARALSLARAAGVTTVLNPAPAQKLAAEILDLVDIVTPNEGEAAALTGASGAPPDLARRLLETGVRTVCLTLGEHGAFLASSSGLERSIPAPVVQVVDTTAAGDVLNGALASQLKAGGPPDEAAFVNAVTFAVRAASLSCTRVGAQPSIPRLRELRGP